MKSSWTKGLEKDEGNEVVISFKGSRVLRDRLKVLIEGKVKSSETASISKEGYGCPNWGFKQADAIGYKRCAKEIILLLFEDN